MRVGMIALGIGLGILWIAGLEAGAAPWMSWLDLLAALVSLAVPLAADRLGSAARVPPFALSIGVGVLWIVGLAVGVRSWLAWWNFAFAIGYLVLGFAALTEPGAGRPVTGPRRP